MSGTGRTSTKQGAAPAGWPEGVTVTVLDTNRYGWKEIETGGAVGSTLGASVRAGYVGRVAKKGSHWEAKTTAGKKLPTSFPNQRTAIQALIRYEQDAQMLADLGREEGA